MPPKRTKIKQSDTSVDEDIMSKLPRNVIDCILGKMRIRDAIRTSVLSKKWRFYYLTISELVFDEHFCKQVQDYAAAQKKLRILSEYELELKYQFDEIVTKSLMLHPGRIETFKACIPSFNSTRGVNVNKWILYLSRKNIKKLNLEYLKRDSVRHKLPPYFFSCLDLTYLKLRNFDFSPPPPECKGFLYLDQLVLIGVCFANNCFESILSGCPVLQMLKLHMCTGIRHVNICGSKLERLRVKANDKFESISLENAPNLTEVSVMLDRIVTDSDKVVIGLEANPNSDLVMFVDSCPRVELLRLNGKFLQLLARTPIPPMLSTSPDSLKILEFKGVNFMNFDEISAVVCLIRSAPTLQELYIEASTVELNQEQVSGYLKLLDCSTFPLSKLHLVKLTNISAFDPEFEFIRFIIFCSPSLATMSILQHPQLEVAEALEITKKLLLFRLSSPVSIEFSSDSET